MTLAARRLGSSDGIEPHRPQTLAHFGLRQVGEANAKRLRVGELDVGFARAAELAVELDRVADVDHHQKGRPAFGSGERAGVTIGLAASADHGVVPATGAAHGGAAPFRFLLLVGRRLQDKRFGFCGRLRVAPLLGFEHERTTTIQVDAADRRVAVLFLEVDVALEDVGVVGVVRPAGLRLRHFQQRAQLGQEELVVGSFGGRGCFPALDELFWRHGKAAPHWLASVPV